MDVVSLDHVQLAAPRGCEAEARRFFGELLGMPELPKPDALKARGGVWFAAGEQQLHIGVEEAFSPSRKAHVGFRVHPERLHLLAARLDAAGATVTWDDALPQDRRFYSEDPWGNRIEFLSARSPRALAHARRDLRALPRWGT